LPDLCFSTFASLSDDAPAAASAACLEDSLRNFDDSALMRSTACAFFEAEAPLIFDQPEVLLVCRPGCAVSELAMERMGPMASDCIRPIASSCGSGPSGTMGYFQQSCSRIRSSLFTLAASTTMWSSVKRSPTASRMCSARVLLKSGSAI